MVHGCISYVLCAIISPVSSFKVVIVCSNQRPKGEARGV